MLDERMIGSGQVIMQDFAGKTYVFNYCRETQEFYSVDFAKKIRLLIVKPNPTIYYVDGCWDHLVTKKRLLLIKDFHIDPEIFNELVEGRFIRYSTFISDLYDLPREYSLDVQYHNRDYKVRKNKAEVLQRFRKGEFN